MQDKKFWSVSAGIVFVLFISWNFIISPTQQQIKQYKKKCKNLHSLTNKIHSQEYPPYDHVLSYINNHKATFQKNIQRLNSKVTIKPSSSDILEPTNFRKILGEKLSSIQDKTNRLGIKFDSKLGFSQEIKQVYQRHYTHLKIVHYALLKLTEVVEQKSEELEIENIEHLTLGNSKPQLINRYTLKITINAELHTIMKWLHTLSQPIQEQEIFFHIDNVSFKNHKQKLVGASIFISAIHVDLEKKDISPDKQQEDKNTSDPLWERYR
ncbi:hypothetical protein [Candidatus Uabimicrobium sp. HlEnr_7]|uniref:hypothetical protein n=1 Tax=Candidatus Uabimicrobium helgolandensis TaxID=3095367 RepID=UPI00355666B9